MKNLHLIIYILISLISGLQTTLISAMNASMVIFSFDRPLQLAAALESIDVFVSGIDEISVLYRTSNGQYDDSYNQCFKDFKHLALKIYKQGNNPGGDFKPLLLDILKASKNEYVFFVVDDTFAVGTINTQEYLTLLKEHNAYCFYLGLGKNITESYILKSKNLVPAHVQINNDVISWKFADGIGEWSYPNGVDRTIFKRDQVIEEFEKIHFVSPGTLEAQWFNVAKQNGTMQKPGLCYMQSKMINIPFNMVQQDWQTDYNTQMTKEECLEYFKKGHRIDILKYCNIIPRAPHIDLPLYLKKIK